MGVRGLSTFIKERREKFLTRHQLCNEVVVIDGDNLIHYINARSKGLNLAFGGDYHKYSAKVESFFNDLKRCGITPIVLLDGGSDPSNRKLKTAFTRLTSKLDSTKKLAPATQHRHSCLPLLSKTAFVEVLSRLGLPYAVCPFEADEPLAALARRLNCSVISDDTDFFAFGVRCVPLGSLADEPELRMDGQMAIECLLFRHDRFMQEYGLRPQLMPLLACLLGNDYISPGSLRAFFRHVPRPYGERRGRPSGLRIKGALAWLKRHTDPEEALQEVLSRIRKEERQHVGRLVRRLMDNYTGHGWPEDLLGQLALPQEVLDAMDVLPPIDQCGNQPSASEPGDRIAAMSLDDDGTEAPARIPGDANADDDDVALDDASDDSHDDGSNDSADDGCDDATADASGDDALGNDVLDDDAPLPAAAEGSADGRLLLDGAPLPDWLAESLRRGRFTADVINLISGQPLLEEPQVEDPRQPPSCVCVEPLLRWMSWCLHSQPDRPVITYRRADSGRSVVRGKLEAAVAGTPPPPLLSAVPGMALAERRRAVLMALEAGSDGVKELEAVLEELPPRLRLLAVALRYWRRATVSGVTAAHLGALLLPKRRSQPGVIPLAAPDAALLSGAASFERRLAHQLAQLQCVLAQTNNVNALMATPLEPVSPARAFAGPLVYNAITQLRVGGLEKAADWLSDRELEEWNRELRLLCRATGIDPELKPTPVPAHVRKRDSARPTATASDTAPKGATREAGGDEEEGSKRKVMRKSRPQPQLTGNKFAALLQGSDDDETSSDDS